MKKPLELYSGEDMTAVAFNAAGGHGCISVTSNVAPRLCAEFLDGCRAQGIPILAGRGVAHGKAIPMLPMLEQLGGVWIAWGEPEGCFQIPPHRPRFELRQLALSPEQILHYYHGLSNSALWPLCHSFLGRVHSDSSDLTKKAKDILQRTGAQDISSTGEASADYAKSDASMPRGATSDRKY